MNPLLWIMAALMAAGTGAQYQGAKKVDKERTKAMIEERTRREKRQRENEATAEQTMGLFADQGEKETAAAAEREKAITNKVEAPTTNETGQTLLDPQATPSGVNVQDAADQVAKSNEYLASRAKLRAVLGGYGDVMGQTGAAATRFGQDIDANNQAIRNWQQYVLPQRLEYANQSGREWSTAGDVMKLAAAIMAPYALGTGAASTGMKVAEDMAQEAAAAATQGASSAVATGMSAATPAVNFVQPAAAAAGSTPLGSIFDPMWFLKPGLKMPPIRF